MAGSIIGGTPFKKDLPMKKKIRAGGGQGKEKKGRAREFSRGRLSGESGEFINGVINMRVQPPPKREEKKRARRGKDRNKREGRARGENIYAGGGLDMKKRAGTSPRAGYAEPKREVASRGVPAGWGEW